MKSANIFIIRLSGESTSEQRHGRMIERHRITHHRLISSPVLSLKKKKYDSQIGR